MLNARNRDIAAQMDEITREKELAEQAKESKTNFISNITHEMKHAVTSIRGICRTSKCGGMNEKAEKKRLRNYNGAERQTYRNLMPA